MSAASTSKESRSKESTWRLLTPHLVLASFSAIMLVGVVVGFDWLSGARSGRGWILALSSLAIVAWTLLWSLRWSRQVLAGASPEQIITLPQRFARLHGGSWAAGTAVLGGVWLLLSPYQSEVALLVVIAGVLVGMGAWLVALLSTPYVLGPRWQQAISEMRSRGSSWGRHGQSLQRRVALLLGTLVFFACAFALYSAFAMQREIVAYYAQSQAQEVAQRLGTELRNSGKPADVDVCGFLANSLPSGSAAAWHQPDTNPDGLACNLGLGVDELAALALFRGTGARMADPGRDLEGAIVRSQWGNLALLVPRPEWTRRATLVLSVFFTILFLFSAWLASLVSRGMTWGVLDLKQQVQRMESGDLQTPFQPQTLDEVGELAVSMERMRQGVSDMVETIRSLNLTLEQKVKLRTEELQQANEELVLAMERLKAAQAQLVTSEKLASLGRLLAGLAHELRNPVNAIVNNAEPLKEKLGRYQEGDALDARTLQRLVKGAEVIEHAGKRTVALLQSLTNLSRPDAAERKSVSLMDVVQSAMTVMAHRLEEAKVEATLHLDPAVLVLGHAGELGQLVVNLLDNAIDAAAAQEDGPRQVSVLVSQAAEGAHLEVWDSGRGIADEDLPRLFEPFFTRKATGTGLGLAIVHQIATRHGASVDVRRSEGRTGFVVSFQASGRIDSLPGVY